MSSPAAALLRDPSRQPGGYQGTVAVTPEDATERLQVTIDSFADQRPFEAAWAPRPGDAGPELPTAGDACLVALDEAGDAWVLVWWPYD